MFTVQVPSWAGNTQRWTRPSLISGCLCNPALVEQNQIILPASPCSPCHATPPSFSLIPWGLISRRAPRLFPEQLPSWAPSRLAFRGVSPQMRGLPLPPAALLAPTAPSRWPAGLCSPEPVPQCSGSDLVAKRRGSPRAQTFHFPVISW